MPAPDGARDEDPEEHRNEAQRRDRHGHGRDVPHDGRTGTENEPQQVREARRDVRRGDARERENDQELSDLDGGEVFDSLSPHRARAASATSARRELLDELRTPDRVDRGLARREHGEKGDKQQLQQEQLHNDCVH